MANAGGIVGNGKVLPSGGVGVGAAVGQGVKLARIVGMGGSRGTKAAIANFHAEQIAENRIGKGNPPLTDGR